MAHAHTLCPYCGHNFEADAPVERGTWRIDPRSGTLAFGRVPVPIRLSHIRLIYTIASAAPSIVKPDAILNRISSSEDVNLVRVMICQIRRKWPAQVPWPIKTVHGHGYRWNGGLA